MRTRDEPSACGPAAVASEPLDSGAVHVLTFRLCARSGDERLLSRDESARAGRFRFQRDRDRFVAGRAQIRRILGLYSGTPPEAVRFGYGAFGKPEIAGPLHFNISHSGDLAAAAVASFPVGIDIEQIRPVGEELAERFFAEDEAAALRSLPEAERTASFFAGWTRKEAYIKATGDGLQTPLDSFSVSLAPMEQARLLRVRGRPSEAARWQLRHLDVAPGVCGAVAARRTGWHVFHASLRAPPPL